MIETIDTVAGLERIADAWRSLACGFSSPLLQYEWFLAGAKAFCPPDKLDILVKRANGRISAIAPLALVKEHTKGRLEILGTEILCEPSGLLYDSEAEVAALIDHIIAQRKPTVLRRLPADSPVVGLLEAKHKGLGFQAERSSGSPWLPIILPWNEFEQSISAKNRYTLRRARKRADALGTVAFDFRVPGIQDVERSVDDLVRVEGASWKERKGTSLGSHPQLKRFFRGYMLSAAAAGTLRVNFLTINGAAVAALMGVEYANRFWVLKISFDEAFAHCSPGVLLMHEAIRRAVEHELEAFEFLGTDEPWLHLWTNDVHQYVGIHLYPLSLRGLMNLGSDSSSYLLNRLPAKKSRSTRE
jgi:CelD/BcsL family acetyltransferase involved in cellulose biosynthesis